MPALVSRLRPPRRKMSVLVAVSAAVLAVLTAGVLSQSAGASTQQPVSGSFDFAGSLVVGCPIGAVLCTHGTFSGDVNGQFQFSILTLLPSATAGVSYFDGKLVLHTASGDVKCDLNGALNTNTTSQGEFGEICVITGGTGAYSRATGHFRLIGTSNGSLVSPAGGGVFQGLIKTP